MRQLQRPQLTQRGKLALRPLPSSTSCSSCKTKILEKKLQKIAPAPQREDLRTELNELFDTADVQPQLQQGPGESQSIDVSLWKLMISLLQTDRGLCTPPQEPVGAHQRAHRPGQTATRDVPPPRPAARSDARSGEKDLSSATC